MTMSDTLLFNDPKVKMLAMEAIEESIDFQAFGRRMLELLTNSLISARADEACGAEYKERSPERTNCRNGYRNRRLVTSVGDIELRIPKLRSGTFFPEDLIERYCRIDRALVAAVAEMYVSGVSTRKVESVAEAFGIRSMSKSQVSRMCACLDAEVAARDEAPLHEIEPDRLTLRFELPQGIAHRLSFPRAGVSRRTRASRSGCASGAFDPIHRAVPGDIGGVHLIDKEAVPKKPRNHGKRRRRRARRRRRCGSRRT